MLSSCVLGTGVQVTVMFELRVISVAGGARRPRSLLRCGTVYEAEQVTRKLAAMGCTVDVRNLQTGEVKRHEPQRTSA
jgi:hypothetical protein